MPKEGLLSSLQAKCLFLLANAALGDGDGSATWSVAVHGKIIIMQAGDAETCGLILLEFFITMLWQIRSLTNLPKEEHNKRHVHPVTQKTS